MNYRELTSMFIASYKNYKNSKKIYDKKILISVLDQINSYLYLSDYNLVMEYKDFLIYDALVYSKDPDAIFIYHYLTDCINDMYKDNAKKRK